VIVSAALSSAVLAGITGSASGGMSIALEALGTQVVSDAAGQGVEPALLHRVLALATGSLAMLPHNGAALTLLGICGMTQARSHADIFAVAVAIPAIATVLAIGLGLTFGTF
jgi:H+/gluconate symporter-like permease